MHLLKHFQRLCNTDIKQTTDKEETKLNEILSFCIMFNMKAVQKLTTTDKHVAFRKNSLLVKMNFL